MNAKNNFEAWGVNVFKKNVKLKVPPIFWYQSGLKSVYLQLSNLKSGIGSGDLKFTNNTTIAILKYYKIVIFLKVDKVYSLML